MGNLKHATIAEVVCTDTFETGDSRFKYCQVFYDLVSRWGWVFPMHSKTEVGLEFATFCSQNWVPLILVRDGAGENVGVAPKPSSRESRQRLAGSVSFKPGLEIEKFNENSVSFIMSKLKFARCVFFGKK